MAVLFGYLNWIAFLSRVRQALRFTRDATNGWDQSTKGAIVHPKGERNDEQGRENYQRPVRSIISLNRVWGWHKIRKDLESASTEDQMDLRCSLKMWARGQMLKKAFVTQRRCALPHLSTAFDIGSNAESKGIRRLLMGCAQPNFEHTCKKYAKYLRSHQDDPFMFGEVVRCTSRNGGTFRYGPPAPAT